MQITEYKFANITARPFLTLNDVNNKWIFTDHTEHVIDVCMYREPEVIEAIKAKGATFDWFPTDERPMGVDAILKAVQVLCNYDREGSHIIVHCLHGNNRSRTVVEAFYFAKYCEHYEDDKGCKNHLIWNCEQGYLPPLPEMEKMLRQLTPRPYAVETWAEIDGMSISALTGLSEEEWRVFKEFDKEFPDKNTSELLKMTFEKTGRYKFDEEDRKRYEKEGNAKTIEERADEIIDGYVDFLVLFFDAPHVKFPLLDHLIANPACCDCGIFPPSIFTIPERLQLIREEYALFESDSDKEKFEDQLKDYIHEHIRSIGITGLRILDKVGENKETPLDFPTWYEAEVYEALFQYADWHELLDKVEEYTAQVNSNPE